MELIERANEARHTMMRDRLERRLDETMHDNHRLRDENDRLRTELHRDEEDRKRLWSAIERSRTRQPGRLRGLVMLIAGVCAAYVAGAKAGRQRYEELRAWFDQVRGRAGRVERELSSGGERVSGAVRSTVQDAADAARA